MFGFLKRKKPEAMLVVVRSDRVEWSEDDARWLREVMKTDSWKRLTAFQHDAIFNAVISQQHEKFVTGWRFGLSEIERFAGKEPDRDEKSEE